MNRAAVSILALVLGVSLGAGALTGSGKAAGPLETVRPTAISVTAPTAASLSVTLSEPMLSPGVMTPDNYTVSGEGKGTLAAHPDTVTGTGPHILTWSGGEMRDGALLTATIAGVQDAAGNPINVQASSAQCPGRGILPTFSNLAAIPAQASPGDSVTVTFAASEALDGVPTLTVNGNAAYFASADGNAYVFTYDVEDTDPPGPASLVVSGFDLAGNLGTLSGDALEVLPAATGMPLRPWPAALLLLAVGALILRRLGKSLFEGGARGGLFLVALFLAQMLLCSTAFADSPSVSNVHYAQGPNGSAATKVDIYYDLVAPNGPCAITLSLSKDGGADGFSHPITAYTGDIANMGTGLGWHIVWDIAADYPDTELPNASIRVTAADGVVQHTLTYSAGANGSITGASPQAVNDGGSGTAVTAEAAVGHHFVQWSDGSTDNPRTDTNVTTDITVAAVFAINQYTLTYSAGTNGSITGASPQTVNHGADGAAVTAVPDTGYHFVQWSDNSTQNPRTDTSVTADVDVTASFVIDTLTLTYTAGENGTISGASPQTVNYGGSGAAVEAVPDTGYHFVQWSDNLTQNPRTDANVTGDITVTASFAVNQYALTYMAGAGGSIAGPTPQTVDYGGTGAAVTAVGDAGHPFVQWSDGSTQNPRTDINVTGDITVTASFSINQYALNYLAGEGGSVSGTTPQTVDYGGSGAAVTAVPDAGHHFVQWSDNSTQNPRTDTNVTDNITVTAGFAIDTHTLTYTAGANGMISGTSPQTVNYGAAGAAVTAVPDTGYHFVEWSDNSTQNPRTDTNVTADISVTATFAINQYTLIYSAGDNGTLSGTSPQTVSYGSPGAEVTAVPDTGYHFVQWSDNSTQNPRTDLNVTADITVTASFAIDTHTLTYTAGNNGTISGTSPQTVSYGSPGAEVTAVPDTGYHFVQWSDTSTQNPRTDTNVTADIAVTATFAINQYTLTYSAGANGTLLGVTPQTVGHGGSGTAVTAVPDGGHAFSQWSDGVTTAMRTDSNVTADITVTASFVALPPTPAVTSFAINNDAATTATLSVTLNNTATNSPTDYMASESASFTGAVWTAYSTAPAFTLSFGVGVRTVYFKTRNGAGESGVASDTIFVTPGTVSVAGGTFSMGRLAGGTNDDRTDGSTDEDPVHSVTLAAYSLGKYEVTNREYCDVLNWAESQGYLYSDAAGTPWSGTGDLYAGGAGFRHLLVSLSSTECGITHSGGLFTPKTRLGLPGVTAYPMDAHPMVLVSWFGSVAFCNWLSQWQGLTPCYNMSAANWPLTVAPPASGGYRLPTEAEWERAAAWDSGGSRHWVYGFLSDTLTGRARANYCINPAYVNPLGLTDMPYTSPVGWFNGTNKSPNGNITTVNTVSPVGAYDMSGNVYEWCGDWYAPYGSAAQTNPTGPLSGTYHVIRDGGWDYLKSVCRSASRSQDDPAVVVDSVGFRLAKS